MGQFFLLGPGAPLWLIGLGALLFVGGLRRFRPLGILAAAVFLLMMLAGGKDYYFGPMLAPLIAGATAYLARWLDDPRRTPVYAGAMGFLIVGGVGLLPMGVPILPPAPMARYSAALGVTQATRTSYGTVLPLPQDYADMIGWPELVDTVASVYRSLPPEEQKEAAILGINYGRTGAVALFGRDLGLPYPISRHGDFFLWGPGERNPRVTIVVGGSREGLLEYWEDVTEAARTSNPWGVDEEQSVPIYVCRGPRGELPAAFRRLGPIWG